MFSVACDGGDQGVATSEINQAIYNANISPGWPNNVPIPEAYSLRPEFARAAEGFTRLDFISIKNTRRNSKVQVNRLDGPDCENARKIRIRVKDDFSQMQKLLGFSLSEELSRGPNSAVISRPSTLAALLASPHSL